MSTEFYILWKGFDLLYFFQVAKNKQFFNPFEHFLASLVAHHGSLGFQVATAENLCLMDSDERKN